MTGGPGGVGSGGASEPDRWNHNIHYYAIVLRAVPANAGRALDVGCGAGLLTRRLRAQVRHVVGIDRDRACISAAHEQSGGAIDYVLGDFLRHPFRAESFDFVVSAASLHHMDVGAGLERMRDLLRPGGRLAVIGLARSSQPLDLPCDVAGVVADRLHKRTRTEWVGDPAPRVWPPPLTYGQTRRVASRVLPGATFHRHVLWRYTLTWTKPGGHEWAVVDR